MEGYGEKEEKEGPIVMTSVSLLYGPPTGIQIPGVDLTRKSTIPLITTYWDHAFDYMEDMIEEKYPSSSFWESETYADKRQEELLEVLDKFLNAYVTVAKASQRSVSLDVRRDFKFINKITARGIKQLDAIELLELYVKLYQTTSEIHPAMWDPSKFYQENPEVKEKEESPGLIPKFGDWFDSKINRALLIGGGALLIYSLIYFAAPKIIQKARSPKRLTQ